MGAVMALVNVRIQVRHEWRRFLDPALHRDHRYLFMLGPVLFGSQPASAGLQ